jgi:hypothetical protein
VGHYGLNAKGGSSSSIVQDGGHRDRALHPGGSRRGFLAGGAGAFLPTGTMTTMTTGTLSAPIRS